MFTQRDDHLFRILLSFMLLIETFLKIIAPDICQAISHETPINTVCAWIVLFVESSLLPIVQFYRSVCYLMTASEWYLVQVFLPQNSHVLDPPNSPFRHRCLMADCLSDVWSYNFEEHFNKKHEGNEYPEKMIISDVEKKYILSL